MNRKAAASADKLDLESIEALLKTQASAYDDFLTAVITKTRETEIDQDEISEILERHLGRLQSLTRKAFPTSSLTPLQRSGLDPFRKSYVTPQSSGSLPDTAFQNANKKAGAQKGRFKLSEDVVNVNSDSEKSDEDSLFVGATASKARPNSSANKTGSTSKHPARPSAEMPATRKEVVDDTQNTSYSHSFGAFNVKAGLNARGAVGGASQLFGKSGNGGKLHTPIKSKKQHAIDLDEDSEDDEAQAEFDLAADSSDDEKNRGGTGSGSKRRKSAKANQSGWMEPTVNAIHEAAKKRAQNYIGSTMSFKSDISKKGKRKCKSSPSSSFNTSNGEGPSSSKKRSFSSLDISDDDEDSGDDSDDSEDSADSDSTPTKKRKKRRSESGYRFHREEKKKTRKQTKKEKKEKRIYKAKAKDERKRDRQVEKERQATHSMESLDRKTAAGINKRNGAASQFIDLTLDSDDDDIMAAASRESFGRFNDRGARFRRHDSSTKDNANMSFGESFASTIAFDRQRGFGFGGDEVAPTPTPAHRGKQASSAPLPDDIVAGFLGSRSGAGLDDAVEMEKEILLGGETATATGGFDRGAGESVIVDVAAAAAEARRLMVEREQQDTDGYYHDADDDED